MNPKNDLLEHAIDLFPQPDTALDGIVERFVVRRRHRRLGAGMLGLAIALAAIYVGTSVIRSAPIREPQVPSPMTAVGFVDIRTGRATPLPGSITSIIGASNFQASPDGSRLAFQAVGENTGLEIYVANLDGTQLRQVTDDPRNAAFPRWSPDGDAIAFVSGTGEDTDISIVNVSTQETTGVLQGSGEIWHPSFSPDGRTILFTMATEMSSGAWRVDLWTVSATGGQPTRLIQHAGYGSYSPDGSTIAYHRTSPHPGAFCGSFCWWVDLDVSLTAADGSEQLGRSHGGMIAPPEVFESSLAQWSPDGSRVLYTGPTNRGDPARMNLLDVASGKVSRIGLGSTPTWLDDDTLIVSSYGRTRRQRLD